MAAVTDMKKENAELFLKKIASKLPVQSTSESTVIGLFEGIVESLEKSVVRTTILAELDYFYGVFEVALKKQIEVTQPLSSSVRKSNKSELKELANAQFPLVEARVLLGTLDENFITSNILGKAHSEERSDKAVVNTLIAIQCNQYNASEMAGIILRAKNVLRPCSAAEQLSKSILTRLILNSEWSKTDTEQTACLWGLTTMLSASPPFNTTLITLTNKAFALLHGQQADFPLFSLGFLGFWGLQNIKNRTETNEKNKINTEQIEMTENDENLNIPTATIDVETLKLILNFLNSSNNEITDFEYSDVVLCLSVLYIYLSKIVKNDMVERTMVAILVQLSAVSPQSNGNVQLFWSDSLLPLVSSKIGVGKTIKNKIKSFSNIITTNNKNKSNGNSNNTPLNELYTWIADTNTITYALLESMADLVRESSSPELQESDEIGENGVNGENGEKTDENTDSKEKSSKTAETKKRKSLESDGNIIIGGGENDNEDGEGEGEEEILMGTYEIDVTGEKNSENISSILLEETKKKVTKIPETPSRKSSRNKKIAENDEEKSEMELELQILEKEKEEREEKEEKKGKEEKEEKEEKEDKVEVKVKKTPGRPRKNSDMTENVVVKSVKKLKMN